MYDFQKDYTTPIRHNDIDPLQSGIVALCAL